MGESMAEYVKRRAREAATRLSREAESVAHQAYGNATRIGRDLKLKSAGDVVQYGSKLLREGEKRAGRALSGVVQETRRQADETLRRASQNPTIRSAAVDAARTAGNVVGIGRGGVHAVQGLVDGAVFVHRLADPVDRFRSPPGESAAEQLSRSVLKAGRETVDYVQQSIADPHKVVRDIDEKAGQWRRDLDPSATPPAATLKGELGRNFDIGQNQGELVFDVGSLVIGGPASKAVKGLSRAENVGNVEKYLAQGFSPKAAAHLAEPYPTSNMGSHFVARRTRLPEFLGGGPLPKSYMDGPFNKLIPPGISRGDMYVRHFQVDPRFYGTGVRGERWSGRDLGLKRHGLPGQLWYGSPAPLKARVGGLGAAAGGGLHDLEGD